MREVSGYNASECVEPRNSVLSQAADAVTKALGNIFITVIRRGYKNLTGSKAIARYQKELV